MAANEEGLNNATLPDLTPTEYQCVKAYISLLRKRWLL
jgi:hypothetical protein